MSSLTPGLSETFLLASDALQRQIVSIHVKRTYRISKIGLCERAEVSEPFLNFDHEAGQADSDADEPRFPESDIIPHKAGTDLIVMASAHAPRGRPTRRMVASIECGSFRRSMLVMGERRCIYRGRGSIAFPEPEPFDVVPLRYEHAYGGVDPTIEPERPQTMLEALTPHPGIYPRNPAGRGYVVSETASHIEGLALPRIESPRDELTPERLVCGHPSRWWHQPLPWSCDWFDMTWYPRSLFSGGIPDFLPEDDTQVEEVRLGFIPPGYAARFARSGLEGLVDPRYADAASPGMVLPFMRGDESIRLVGMSPSQSELLVRLAGERPRIEVSARGRRIELVPVPNRVLVSAEEMGVYIVWHAAWAPPYMLPERMPANPHMAPSGWDLAGIEAFVDGHPIAPLA